MEYSKLVGSFVLSFVLCVQIATADIPPELKGCQQSKPDFTKCVIGETNKAIKLFKNGYKKFGLLPLDPLRVTKVLIHQGNGPVSINFTFTDMDVHNLSKLKVLSGMTDWKEMTAKLHLDKARFVSNYEGAGKVLSLPIRGKGKSEIILEDMGVDLKIIFKPSTKGGKKYLSIEKLNVNISPKKGSFRMDNLFDGNKQLSDNMNVFLNENANVVLEELTPAINKAIEVAITSTVNKVFANIPSDQIVLK